MSSPRTYSSILCFTFTGKELDQETGYSYFGARYLDHELLTSWLSVDPMADKYPSISPYAYCAWNPLKLVDPDGKDGVLIVDHENKTVTVKAQYAVLEHDQDARKTAEMGIKYWNDLSGQYTLKYGNDIYTINFELSIFDFSEYDDNNECHNYIILVSGFNDENTNGETDFKHIRIRESKKNDYRIVAHEIGHSLGIKHNTPGITGLMDEDSGNLSHDYSTNKFNIWNIFEFPNDNEQRDSESNLGIITLISEKGNSVDLFNKQKTRLLYKKR